MCASMLTDICSPQQELRPDTTRLIHKSNRVTCSYTISLASSIPWILAALKLRLRYYYCRVSMGGPRSHAQRVLQFRVQSVCFTRTLGISSGHVPISNGKVTGDSAVGCKGKVVCRNCPKPSVLAILEHLIATGRRSAVIKKMQ